jgi:hypothetical protein
VCRGVCRVCRAFAHLRPRNTNRYGGLGTDSPRDLYRRLPGTPGTPGTIATAQRQCTDLCGCAPPTCPGTRALKIALGANYDGKPQLNKLNIAANSLRRKSQWSAVPRRQRRQVVSRTAPLARHDHFIQQRLGRSASAAACLPSSVAILHDGIADGIGWSLLALPSSWHSVPLPLICRACR